MQNQSNTRALWHFDANQFPDGPSTTRGKEDARHHAFFAFPAPENFRSLPSREAVARRAARYAAFVTSDPARHPDNLGEYRAWLAAGYAAGYNARITDLFADYNRNAAMLGEPILRRASDPAPVIEVWPTEPDAHPLARLGGAVIDSNSPSGWPLAVDYPVLVIASDPAIDQRLGDEETQRAWGEQD